MRKVVYLNLAVAIALGAGILLLSSRPGPWALDSEKTFIAGLHNSLYYLELAKLQWAEEKNKSELDIPTLEDLTPYLGNNRDRLQRFMALGITYKITSTEERQSDVAMLTRDLRFRRGYYLLYTAGTKYCIHTGWAHPPRSVTSTFRTLYIKNNLDHLLEAAFAMLVVGNLLVLLTKKKRNSKQTAVNEIAH